MKWVIRIVLLALLAALGAGSAALWWLNQPLELAADTVELSIEAGVAPREIAQGWVRAGVRTSPLLLYEWFRWSGQARRIRAGSYEIGAGTTPRALLEKMVRGDESLTTVRLIEGWPSAAIRSASLMPEVVGLSASALASSARNWRKVQPSISRTVVSDSSPRTIFSSRARGVVPAPIS